VNRLAGRIARLSEWIDGSPENADRDPEAATWGRLSKIVEEAGEVISAYIGVTGQNPRKGRYADMGDVRKELLDVALTALAAYEHTTGADGSSIEVFAEHTNDVFERAGLED
jgi:NTP pyrophosphatase (non-canonical NTP hydrolase)